ncbi:MAG: YkgJ family cysteine cluster protein [Anaerolineales bacterium]
MWILDPQRINKLAQEKEDENWEFRAFLKGIDMRSEELDALVHGLYRDISSRIDCLECGNCCRSILPNLSPADITDLAAGLSMSKAELTRRYLTTREDQNARTFNATPCPFLDENQCTVYENRPQSCRSYPHLHKQRFVHRLIQVVANCAVCPIVFNVYEELKKVLWQPYGYDQQTPWWELE